MSVWGVSYADFARKAEEAVATSSAATWSTTNLFNLDSMQLGGIVKGEEEKATSTTGHSEQKVVADGTVPKEDARKEPDAPLKELSEIVSPPKEHFQENGLSSDDVPVAQNDHNDKQHVDGNAPLHSKPSPVIVDQRAEIVDSRPTKIKEEEDEILATNQETEQESSAVSNIDGSAPSEKASAVELTPEPAQNDSVSAVLPAAPQIVASEEKSKGGQLPLANNDNLLEHFSNQIRRLEEAHASEIADMERRHALSLQEATKSDRMDKMKQEIAQLQRDKAAVKQQMDKIQQEKQDLEQTVQTLTKDVGKGSALHKRDIKILQEQLVEREQKASQALDQASALKAELEKITASHNQLIQTHEEAMARSKIATNELNSRRVECRELTDNLRAVTEENKLLQSQLESLQLQLSNNTLNRTEQVEHFQALQQQVQELTAQLKRTQQEHAAAFQKSETSLREYKKRAQHELAVSQARSASAVQAKEEAELEARAARTMADAAMERAVKAELAAKEAITQQKVATERLEREAKEAIAARDDAQQALAIAQAELKQRTYELEKAITYKEQVDRALAASNAQYEAEVDRAAFLQKQVASLEKSNQNLDRNLEQLRGQLEQLSESAANATTSLEPEEARQYKNTIASLEDELKEANMAIEDLKDALKTSMMSGESRQQAYSGEDGGDGAPRSARSNHNSQNALFYAMEKQAELKTAQAEINRLASLLADFQTERTEAMDSVTEYKSRMEAAEAHLERYKKLVLSKHKGLDEELSENNGTPKSAEEPDSAATNIEYLKNIVLRFLSAKTIQERRALLPVIGAVLCLTPAEIQKASAALESTAAAESTSSFFKSLIK